jgi:2-amino-4-hydroxy-6-hydroxymethyldihydropteridine diphosphokinase
LTEQRYLVALGSNQRHPRHGDPRAVIAAALGALRQRGIAIERASQTWRSAPIGPSNRQYANAAAAVRTALSPPDLLARLKQVERDFGRRPGGQRWRSRVLDLDIILWSGGCWSDPALTVPHPAFRARPFVLGPAAAIAPAWRDPITRRTVRQLYTRLTRKMPLP